MKAFSIAKAELSSLLKLYDSTLYAYSQVDELLRYKAYCKYNRQDGQVDSDLKLITPIKFKLKKSFKNRLHEQMRELIFVRLVSVLETYLVDTLRDIFLKTKRPFYDQNSKVDFTQAELLSSKSISTVYSKIINKECRKLTSGGFNEILKYYRSRFHIDLAAIPPGKTAMIEYHERRHLLVHRLGKPDKHYKKLYSCSDKKLNITEDYLSKCFFDFEKFISNVHLKVTECVNKHKNIESDFFGNPSICYRIMLLRPDVPPMFQENFQFWVADEFVLLSDIAYEIKHIDDSIFELFLRGKSEILYAYSKHIRRCEKRGQVIATVLSRSGIIEKKPPVVNEELIASVKDSLPEQPWPKGIHKDIAKSIGSSNRKVSAAINILIERKEFFNQKNGVIIN